MLFLEYSNKNFCLHIIWKNNLISLIIPNVRPFENCIIVKIVLNYANLVHGAG